MSNNKELRVCGVIYRTLNGLLIPVQDLAWLPAENRLVTRAELNHRAGTNGTKIVEISYLDKSSNTRYWAFYYDGTMYDPNAKDQPAFDLWWSMYQTIVWDLDGYFRDRLREVIKAEIAAEPPPPPPPTVVTLKVPYMYYAATGLVALAAVVAAVL